ncbi:MAG: GlsB/YeaQ/YmgE family stress response membrane protein [Patescibacteria group bacterium]|nr:GlsB/YeaQ/YmgE family stress response membrane protein [Patescibacteria group bacterium]
MGWIITIIVGGIIGWLASLIMGTDYEQGLLWNIVVGIIGSVLGKWIFYDWLGIGGAAAAGTFSIWGLVWGIIGAVILIGILKLLHILK